MTKIPLMVAAANGYCDIVQLLVSKGANVNVQVTSVSQPLNFLISLTSNLAKQSVDTLSSPLHEAASSDILDVVEFLLEAGADISSQNVAGEVPFDCSSSSDVRK